MEGKGERKQIGPASSLKGKVQTVWHNRVSRRKMEEQQCDTAGSDEREENFEFQSHSVGEGCCRNATVCILHKVPLFIFTE